MCSRERQPSYRWRAGAATLEMTRGRPVEQPSTVKEESGRTWVREGSWPKAQRHHDHDHRLLAELKSRNQRAACTRGSRQLWGPRKPLSFRRSQLWEPWKTLFRDSARVERASGALSALKLDSLALAARCRRHPLSLKSAVLDQFPMSDKKKHTPQPHAQTQLIPWEWKLDSKALNTNCKMYFHFDSHFECTYTFCTVHTNTVHTIVIRALSGL